MDKRIRVFVLSVAVVACVLYALGPAFGAIDVPAKFKDIPLYDGSKIVHAMDMENNAMLGATVKASADAVAEFYKNAMKGSGWKLVFQMDQDKAKILHFQKGNLVLQVTIQADEKEALTTYNLVIATH
ncbi:MAG: hypothetical protein ACLQJ7_18675 [Syntrophobacteraceae bacterium]